MSKKRPTFPLSVQKGCVTVKIYRVQNKGRTAYTVSYFANGKRSQKMFTDFTGAEADAKAKADALSKGEVEVLELTNSDRLAYLHALEVLTPTGVALEMAAKEYAEAWKAMGGKASILEAAREFARRHLHELPDKVVPEAAQEMLAAKERDGMSEAYLKWLRLYLGQLRESFTGQVRSLTTSQLTDYLREMTVSARSKNNARAALSGFFTYCKERGWLPRDHEGVSLVPKFKEKPTDIQIFTPPEMASFLTYAPRELVPYLALGAFAGLRTAEIERLDWSEVHLADRFIEIKAAKAKTASRRLVPMTENLAQWLTKHVLKEGRVLARDHVSNQIRELVKATNDGLQAAVKEAGKDGTKVKPVKWKTNALRHSFISYRVADIQNVNQVALEAGNSPAVIFKHYRELVRPAQAKQWFGIVPEKSRNATAMPNARAA